MPATQQQRDARNRLAIWIVGLFLFFLAAYGSGLGQGMRAARKAQLAQRIAESQLGVARTQLAELEARRQLDLTLTALDQRNFGIAQNHLSTAATLLDNAGGGSGDLAALAKQIKAMNVVAASAAGGA